jgi:hypothetical protein
MTSSTRWFRSRAVVSRGKPQLGGVPQRPARGQLGVHDVLLGDQPDPVLQLGVVLVQVAVVVEHGALARGVHPGQRAEQRRLAGAARADHAEQAALAEREAHPVQQHLAAGQAHGEVLHAQRDFAGVDELLQFLPDEMERGRPDADDVRLGHRGGGHPLAVDERAVVAGQVGDLVPAAAGPAQLGVVAGDAEVGDDDVVVGRAPDPQPPGGQPHDRAGRADDA